MAARQGELRLLVRVPAHFRGSRLIAGSDDDLVDVDVRWLGNGPADALGYVLGAKRLHSLIDARGRLLITDDPDQREICLYHAGCYLGHAHRFNHQVHTQHTYTRGPT